MYMTVNIRFAILLAEKQIKERRNISLAEVAEKTGVSRKTLYAWQNNTITRVDLPVLSAICEYFNVMPADLMEFVIHDEKKEGEKPKAGKPRPRKPKKEKPAP